MTLAQARAAIDQIDRELAELMCRRMELTDEVAQQKRQQGLPVFQASRERQVLDGVRQQVPPAGGAAAAIQFACLMDLSRAQQHRQLAPPGPPLPEGEAVCRLTLPEDPDALRRLATFLSWAGVCPAAVQTVRQDGALPVTLRVAQQPQREEWIRILSAEWPEAEIQIKENVK